VADSWIDQNSSSDNKGTDSILKVRSKQRDNFRALIRFTLPAIPAGCNVASATLRLYSASYTAGRTLQALRVSASWTEMAVTWDNQPETTGAPATIVSGPGYRDWDVTGLVQAMYESQNHGFLIRDAVEDGDGAEQSFHAREKAPDPGPELTVTFGPLGGS
jgi:hypothetical protein